ERRGGARTGEQLGVESFHDGERLGPADGCVGPRLFRRRKHQRGGEAQERGESDRQAPHAGFHGDLPVARTSLILAASGRSSPAPRQGARPRLIVAAATGRGSGAMRARTRSWGVGLAALVAAAAAPGAAANDSSAELATGGLVLTKNPAIEMRSEDLFISTKAVR